MHAAGDDEERDATSASPLRARAACHSSLPAPEHLLATGRSLMLKLWRAPGVVKKALTVYGRSSCAVQPMLPHKVVRPAYSHISGWYLLRLYLLLGPASPKQTKQKKGKFLKEIYLCLAASPCSGRLQGGASQDIQPGRALGRTPTCTSRVRALQTCFSVLTHR